MDNLNYIISELFKENSQYNIPPLPDNIYEKRRLLRSLINRRPPVPVSGNLLKAQDRELQKQLNEKGIVEINETMQSPVNERLRLWKGDITRLKADAIVNAANSQLLGCFVPLHGCIDNAIHSAAGIQMRLECHELIKNQGYPEITGSAKMTKGYNLPAKYVIHTVGPIIEYGKITQKDVYLLSACYQSCLLLADKSDLRSIVFCCISTGEYSFPNQPAAEIAVSTVSEYFESHPASGIETVVFNVFKDIDYTIYCKLLHCDQQ
jgi:O-acetyl-ADP-ribose deacetylase (regulator of RNase III)